MLEILSQCACSGINECDLGRRAGLSRDKKGGKGKGKEKGQKKQGQRLGHSWHGQMRMDILVGLKSERQRQRESNGSVWQWNETDFI